MSNKFARRMVLLGSSLLLILTLQSLPSIGIQRSKDAHLGVEHTLQVLNASANLLSTVENGETSERGYLLTGDAGYLQPFQASLSIRTQQELNLRQLTVDNPRQQKRIVALNTLVETRFSQLTQIIELYKSQGPKAAVAAVANGEGSHVMNEILRLSNEIQQEERQLLEVRGREAAAESAALWRTMSLGRMFLFALLAVFGFVSERDIAEHKRTVESVKASEEQFHTLANAIPQLCWIAAADGEIFWYNQRWYDFTGKTFDELKGFGWQSVHDPKVLPSVMKRWLNAIDRGETFEMTFPLRGTNGEFRHFLTRVMPMHDQSGKVTRWFGTNTDISDQRRTEDALRENQERLRLSQEVARIGTFEWNLQTGTKQHTSELEAIYGVMPGAFAENQKTWLDLIYPEHAADIAQKLADARATGTFEAEWRLVWPNGDEHWHFGRARVIKDDAGEPLRLIGAIVDVTGRKRAELEIIRINNELEERINQRTAELQAANKELAAFSYSVSHDLRAPLRGIDGWSLALLEDYGPQLDPTAQTYLNRVRAETQRMGNLIDDMLRLSRVTRDEMRFDPVDLTALANAISRDLSNTQPERSLQFSIAPSLVASGDKKLLEIALANLFNNAVKFTGKREKAVIEFGKTEREGKTAFYIRDNGAGFDMAYVNNLFGTFQRLHKVNEFPGTGIGLAIVQRVIDRHRGHVWAEAELDCGATFWFTLGG